MNQMLGFNFEEKSHTFDSRSSKNLPNIKMHNENLNQTSKQYDIILNIHSTHWNNGPLGWVCRLHRLHLCWGVRPSNECPVYDTKQCDGEVPVILEIWGMRGTSSLPSLPGPLWPGMVAPDRVLSMGQIELNCVLMLNWTTWNRAILIFKLRTHAKLNCLK